MSVIPIKYVYTNKIKGLRQHDICYEYGIR